MKYFLFLIIFLGVTDFADAQPAESMTYSFISNLINKKGSLLRFTYKNESNFAQCIRSADLSFQLRGDALYVKSTTGEEIKYVGPLGKNTPIGAQNFIIVPPGGDTTASIRLLDFYKLKKGEINVSYSMPVIPCKYLLEKYISLPLPVFMKDKINDPTVEKTDIYTDDYPEWTQYGFIAISNPLKLEL